MRHWRSHGDFQLQSRCSSLMECWTAWRASWEKRKRNSARPDPEDLQTRKRPRNGRAFSRATKMTLLGQHNHEVGSDCVGVGVFQSDSDLRCVCAGTCVQHMHIVVAGSEIDLRTVVSDAAAEGLSAVCQR